MGIYIFTLFLALFLWIVVNKVKFTVKGKQKLKDQNKAYVVFMGVWLFFITVLRNNSVGADTRTYLSIYSRSHVIGWQAVFRWADTMMIEPGYVICNKALSYINDNPRFILLISAAITISLISYHIFKYSKKPWLSFFMFITLGMFGESLCLMRQYIAVAIIVASYIAIKDNKLLKFVVLVLLAASIHTSAIIMFPMFWISKIKWNKIYFCVIFGVSAFLFFAVMSPEFRFYDIIIDILANHTSYARYFAALDYGRRGGAVGLVLIYFSFLVLIILKLHDSETEFRNAYISFAAASAVLTIFSFILGISERLLPYFASMFLFSVPEAIMNEPKYRIRIQYISAICAVLVLYYIGIVCRADSMSIIPYELWKTAK